MIKVINFYIRKPGISVEESQAYWRDNHSKVLRQITGIRGCVQNHTLLSGYRRPTPPPFDGIEELDFNDLAA
jgi:hypothetical protein